MKSNKGSSSRLMGALWTVIATILVWSRWSQCLATTTALLPSLFDPLPTVARRNRATLGMEQRKDVWLWGVAAKHRSANARVGRGDHKHQQLQNAELCLERRFRRANATQPTTPSPSKEQRSRLRHDVSEPDRSLGRRRLPNGRRRIDPGISGHNGFRCVTRTDVQRRAILDSQSVRDD